MNTNQDKAKAENLDFARLESEISALSWLTPLLEQQVTSTNDLININIAKIKVGAGLVAIAEEQTQGRGRLDRNWATPPGGAIAMSLGIPAQDFTAELTVVPLICGLAVQRALSKFKVPAQLKWPNDIVFMESGNPLRKVGGILVQLVQGNLIIGIGLNVSINKSELPVEHATSLSHEGFDVSREDLIIRILEELKILRTENTKWLTEYESVCASLGKQVRVANADGSEIIGEAISVEKNGAINIQSLENLYQITVGDIEHMHVLAD